MATTPEIINSRVKHDRAFRSSYAKLVAATWHDSNILEALKKNPAKVLAEYGLATKAGAKIHVEVVSPTGEGSIQSQQAAWILGDNTGEYTVWLPAKPSGPVALGDGCTCTPCCCCT